MALYAPPGAMTSFGSRYPGGLRLTTPPLVRQAHHERECRLRAERRVKSVRPARPPHLWIPAEAGMTASDDGVPTRPPHRRSRGSGNPAVGVKRVVLSVPGVGESARECGPASPPRAGARRGAVLAHKKGEGARLRTPSLWAKPCRGTAVPTRWRPPFPRGLPEWCPGSWVAGSFAPPGRWRWRWPPPPWAAPGILRQRRAPQGDGRGWLLPR